MLVYTLPSLMGATVLNRPSKRVRSPYVADIELDDGTIGLCHTPGLGCAGLVAPGKRIYVSENNDTSIKTEWTAHISEGLSSFVGIHPLVTQQAIYPLLQRISGEAEWASEVTVKYSRLDYVGYLPNGKKIYVEVKTAMTSHVPGVALFPDSPSPRAITHTNVLKLLLAEADTHSCHMIYVIPRSDCNSLLINPKDRAYTKQIMAALEKGVRLHAFLLDYDPDGDITFQKKVPIKIV